MLGCKRLKRMRKMTASGFGLKWHMWPFILPEAWGKNWLSRAKSNPRLSDFVIQCFITELQRILLWIMAVVCSYLISILLTAMVRNVESPLQNGAGKKVKNILTLLFLRGTGFLFILGVITAESSTKVMRIKEMIINSRCSWLLKKILLSYHRKCIENSMENMNTDARV